MMTEKKPCPFCGSSNVYHRMTPFGEAIACRNCQAIGPCCRVREGNVELATWQLWNERHVPNPREVRCRLCNDCGTAQGCPGCHKVDPYLKAYAGSLVNDETGDPNS